MPSMLTKSQVIADFLQKFLGLSSKKKARVDRLFLMLRRTTDSREQAEISQAIQEIVDPSLSDSTEAVDPGSGIQEGAKERVAAYSAHVGRIVRARRLELGITQEELAERSGLHQSHVSRIEAGEHTPTYLTIEKLAKALETEPGKLDLLYAD